MSQFGLHIHVISYGTCLCFLPFFTQYENLQVHVAKNGIILIFSLFHIWKQGGRFASMKYGILYISHMEIRGKISFCEIWNFLYFLYENMVACFIWENRISHISLVKIQGHIAIYENRISYISCMNIMGHIAIYENRISYISCINIWGHISYI